MLYYTKKNLYAEIENLRDYIGISYSNYPLDVVSLCRSQKDLIVGKRNFNTKGLKGVLAIQDGLSAIMLDANQSAAEQNFFCAHELIHSALHRDLGYKNFNCFDKASPQQNSSIEWQANEGAAELLIPYKIFIPSFVHQYRTNSSLYIRTALSKKYNVSYQVIYNRIENLRFEIMQYEQGIPIDDIELLSKRKQEQCGIISTDYNALCNRLLNFA